MPDRIRGIMQLLSIGMGALNTLTRAMPASTITAYCEQNENRETKRAYKISKLVLHLEGRSTLGRLPAGEIVLNTY